MAFFADGRDNAPDLTSTYRAEQEKMSTLMREELGSLARDDRFHDYLKMSPVRRMLEHWKGTARIENHEERDRLIEVPEVMYVFGRLTKVNSICNAAGQKLPYDILINRVDPTVDPDPTPRAKKTPTKKTADPTEKHPGLSQKGKDVTIMGMIKRRLSIMVVQFAFIFAIFQFAYWMGWTNDSASAREEL